VDQWCRLRQTEVTLSLNLSKVVPHSICKTSSLYYFEAQLPPKSGKYQVMKRPMPNFESADWVIIIPIARY